VLAILNEWSERLAEGIATAIGRYQQIRPHEDPSLLYARILKVLYSNFRDQINPMSDETAKKVLTHLLNTSAGMKSRTFLDAFQITVQLLMINWGMNPGNPALRGILAIPGGDHKQFMICLIHGIDVRHNAAGNRTFFYHGIEIDEAAMQRQTREPDHGRLNAERLAEICESFDASVANFIDIRYLVHRLQKPAFEVPNPVILSTFLRDSDVNITDVEGTAMRDRERTHSFYVQFLKYFEEDANTTFSEHAEIMKELIKAMFNMYNKNALHLWSVSNAVPAATYMQNNATELPAFAYHGNLNIDKPNKPQEQVRCVGHLGNSFPGCSTIRQGKGMLNMYERTPMPIHVM
jgi:hypothetical protein